MKNRIHWAIALCLLPYIIYQIVLLFQPASLNALELPNDSEPVVFRDTQNKKIIVMSPDIKRIQFYTEPGTFESAYFFKDLDSIKKYVRQANNITYFCSPGLAEDKNPQDNNCLPAHQTEVQVGKFKVNLGYRMVGNTLMKASAKQVGDKVLPHNIPVLEQPAYLYLTKFFFAMFIIGFCLAYIQFHRIIRQKQAEKETAAAK